MQVDIELYRRDIRLESEKTLNLSTIDIAPESPRRTLVFIHGFGGDARQWVYQLHHFSRHDRVIALDLRGHGQSDRPEGPYDVTTLIDDLAAALRTLQTQFPCVLLGHSFGGALAVEFAARYPEKVERVVLIATTGEYPLARGLRWALSLPVVLLNLAYPFVRRALAAPPTVLKRMYQQAVEPWNGWDLLRSLTVPALVIRGHRDRVFARQYFEKVAQVIPDAEDVNVGVSGHLVMLERREAVNRAIERFLDGRRNWSEAPTRTSLMKRRPWLAFYDAGVPYTIGVPDVGLDQFLTSAARRFPHQPAILFKGKSLSYRRLERDANRFARALHQLGVNRGDRVMILLPNLPQTVIAFFGILKAGAVAAFSTPLSNPEELVRQVETSGATALVTLTTHAKVASQALEASDLRHVIYTQVWDYLPWTKALASRLKRARQRADWLSRGHQRGAHAFRRLLENQPPRHSRIEVNPQELAVLQFTGGTTDVPKGVMLTHRNLVANTLQTRHWLPDVQEGHEVVLAVLPFSHIYGLMTAMSVTVAMAGAMVILPTFSTAEVLRSIRRYRPTLFPGVPTMYTAINDFPGVRRFRVNSIRACISGAAPLPVEVQEAFEKLTRGRLVEGYGLTEAGPVTHANPFNGVRKVGSIGIPFPSTEAKIVDLASGRAMGPGKIGELAVRGPQVMRGYWEDPRSTEEVLTADGWLQTGDLARMDEDGYFQIIARKKEMILAGEYQVYPRDVEEVLYEHPKVREATVVGIQKPRWPFQRVKAYVVLRAGEQASEEELIDLCRRRLETYAVPWQVEFVDELPKSFVGKVLRRVLIERDLQDTPEAG